ncbi:MAG: hypothetical protein SGCHY_005030, partial [Lobulomycetales sp.]
CDKNDIWINGLAPSTHEQVLEIDMTNPQRSVEKAASSSAAAGDRARLHACSAELSAFRKACLASWVEHFTLLRVKDLQKAAMERKLDSDRQERQTNEDAFWSRVKQQK